MQMCSISISCQRCRKKLCMFYLPQILKLFYGEEESYCRDENSEPFSIRKIWWLTPKWRAIFKLLIKGLKSQNINRNQSVKANLFVFLFVYFVALRPKSKAMVIAGQSAHLTTLFSWASLNKQLTSNRAHTFACNWQQPFMNDSAEGRRMTVEIISWSISTKVWDRAGIELATPGSAVSFASVTRHVTDCATRPGS